MRDDLLAGALDAAVLGPLVAFAVLPGADAGPPPAAPPAALDLAGSLGDLEQACG